ncbi:FeoB-associated Cys-rich membrane protein [Pontibacter sp. JH31]|uniref:FeoB-associated Cys-rich membrane protein n=1 Tax=Pontibacter aquaedesilientis TaxID=2766980 RepID=A0ABR7XGI7_9BACT|nr:FeoB-associated Cys-rich membrane protein [Pontibacter aquaedesilientis]MBD1397400.1 FeoB-associated Cys-rich membrane protein [Pontibacter aquaedesilientis]
MVQHILIFLIFAAAVAYMGWVLYRSFMPNKHAGCAKGCGSCSAIDFSKIQKELEKKAV